MRHGRCLRGGLPVAGLVSVREIGHRVGRTLKSFDNSASEMISAHCATMAERKDNEEGINSRLVLVVQRTDQGVGLMILIISDVREVGVPKPIIPHSVPVGNLNTWFPTLFGLFCMVELWLRFDLAIERLRVCVRTPKTALRFGTQ